MGNGFVLYNEQQKQLWADIEWNLSGLKNKKETEKTMASSTVKEPSQKTVGSLGQCSGRSMAIVIDWSL